MPKWMRTRFWMESLVSKSSKMGGLTRPKLSVCIVSVNWAIIVAHPVWNTTWWPNTPPPHQNQATMDGFRQRYMDTATKNKLTAAISKWVATACRPVNIVEDEGLTEIICITSNHWTYEAPSRATITSREENVENLYETEKSKVQQPLEQTTVSTQSCSLEITGRSSVIITTSGSQPIISTHSGNFSHMLWLLWKQKRGTLLTLLQSTSCK